MPAAPTLFTNVLILVQALAGLNGGPPPIGIPPLPEKPVLSQVAPEECLFYMSMSGTATPDATSANKTEQLLAEPQFQALLKSVDRIITGAIQHNSDDAEKAEMANHAYGIAKLLVKRPWCVFVSEFEPRGNEAPLVKMGALLYLGEDVGTFRTHFEALLSKAKPGDIKTVTLAGKEFQRAEDTDGTILTWGIHNDILVYGIGEGVIENMAADIKTPAPAWLVELKEQIPVERRAMVSYLNLAAIRTKILAAIEQDSPDDAEQTKRALAALGLDRLKALKAVTGMDEEGTVEKSLIEWDGPFSGPLSILLSGTLTSEDVNVIPGECVGAIALKFSASELFETICTVADALQPGTAQMIKMRGAVFVQVAGFQSVEETLGTLGDTWTFSSVPTESISPYSGMILTVSVKEEFSKVRQAVDGRLTMVSGSGRPGAPKFEKTQIEGLDVSTLQPPNAMPGIAPCWCIRDGRLIVAASEAGMKAALAAKTSGDSAFSGIPAVAEILGETPAPCLLGYSNTKKSVETIYPKLPAMLAAVSPMARQNGIDLNALALPEMSTILPYAEPTMRIVRKTDLGIRIEQRSTFPGIGASAGTAPVMVALLLPAVQAAREAARRAASINNMKQIGLCIFNYETVKNSFPPAYTTDAAGKPLLSWRVHMLPFMGEQKLFEEFHLDEPWDSPHNTKLIPLMPPTFRSPNYAGEPGKTNYLTIRTSESAFPGAEKVPLRDIKDGTASTIMLVEVNNESAVIWTKPDDYVPDPANPLKGLIGLRPGLFNVGFCDGSVRSVSSNIDLKLFKALITRAGGEDVSYRDLAP